LDLEQKTNQYSNLTLNYLEGRPKSERSPLGQFITPKLLRDALIKEMKIESGMRVLDPGVGTGEFLLSCFELKRDLILEGWDVDKEVAEIAKKLVPTANINVQSALDQEWNEDFDIVIGNPPYFEMQNLDLVTKNRYQALIGGRPNIFALFFAVGLGALKKGGRLGYVVPPSMNNGAFFSKLRSYIANNSSIQFLKVYENSKLFADAQTAVQLIVLEKGKKSENYIVSLGKLGKTAIERDIFTENKEALSKEFEGRTTLWNLGYEAVTGSLVWNQHKPDLRLKHETGCVPLLWAHNISDQREIVLSDSHPKKPQYVITKNYLKGPAIIVNRITGSVGQGSLRCAMVPKDQDFVGENHVNVIRIRKGVKPLVSWEGLLDLLRGENINLRIQKLTGNTQISCIELTHFLPLDIQVEPIESSTLF
jgi:adenine-specific DNA-methyltransferase